jgi:hypothetical protein
MRTSWRPTEARRPSSGWARGESGSLVLGWSTGAQVPRTKDEDMTTVEIGPSHLRVEVEGFDKVLALRSSIEVPIEHVRGASRDPDALHEPRGLRLLAHRCPALWWQAASTAVSGCSWTCTTRSGPSRSTWTTSTTLHWSLRSRTRWPPSKRSMPLYEAELRKALAADRSSRWVGLRARTCGPHGVRGSGSLVA